MLRTLGVPLPLAEALREGVHTWDGVTDPELEPVMDGVGEPVGAWLRVPLPVALCVSVRV